MTLYIALLRGLNVGRHNVITKAQIKPVFESIALTQVKT
ncbi:DUF1697 domain-containing protein, partial [Bacillus cereus]|nr:DUF1697 domain-containing protein [Bacillus cereus]